MSDVANMFTILGACSNVKRGMDVTRRVHDMGALLFLGFLGTLLLVVAGLVSLAIQYLGFGWGMIFSGIVLIVILTVILCWINKQV